MAACLWKAARKLYCQIPYVECSRASPVKTCWDIWKEAYFGNVAAFCQFIVATVCACFESVCDSIVGLFFPPPKNDDLLSWIWKSGVEFSENILLSTVSFMSRLVFFLRQTWRFWLFYFVLHLLCVTFHLLYLYILFLFVSKKKRRPERMHRLLENFLGRHAANAA